MDAWLSRYRHFWSERLTALERALTAEKDAS
jgi:hypothetical protein